MKKFIVFYGMFTGAYLALLVIGIVLDTTILRQAGGPGYTLTVFALFPLLPIFLSVVIAYFMTRWILKPSK